METIEETDEKMSFNIEIDDELMLNDVFIHLKSEPLEKQSAIDIPNLLEEHRIVIKKDDDWYASRNSYAYFGEDTETIKQLVNIFKKYGNLYWYVYKKNNKCNIFVINKNLALNHYKQISEHYSAKYDITNLNVFLKIDDNFTKSIVSNKLFESDNIDEYTFLNDLHFAEEEKKMSSVNNNDNSNVKTDMELMLPSDISDAIKKVKKIMDTNNDKSCRHLTDEEQNKLETFKNIYIKILEDKKDDNNLNVKIDLDNQTETINEKELLKIFDYFTNNKQKCLIHKLNKTNIYE
jgi:hypothetical protein